MTAVAALARRLAPTPPGFAPEPGETVLYRHRRRTPTHLYALVLGGFLVLLGIAGGSAPAVRAVLAVVGVVLLAVGVRVARSSWLEDLVITDRRIVRRARGGDQLSLPLAALDDVVEQGTGFRFHAGERELSFRHVGRPRKVRRLVEERAPAARLDVRIDLSCPT